MAMKVYPMLFVLLLIYVNILSSTAVPSLRGQSFVSRKEEELSTRKFSQGMKRIEVADPEGNEKENLQIEVSIDYSGPRGHKSCDPNDPPGCPPPSMIIKGEN